MPETIYGNAMGGNDYLVAGDVITPAGGPYQNVLIGDAVRLAGNARGGNDVLVSGTGNDSLWGDAQRIEDSARGGNDIFVFRPGSAHDRIQDFGQGLAGQNLGRDLIDVRPLGISAFASLSLSAYDVVEQVSMIFFSPADDVVVKSLQPLAAADFLFA